MGVFLIQLLFLPHIYSLHQHNQQVEHTADRRRDLLPAFRAADQGYLRDGDGAEIHLSKPRDVATYSIRRYTRVDGLHYGTRIFCRGASG